MAQNLVTDPENDIVHFTMLGLSVVGRGKEHLNGIIYMFISLLSPTRFPLPHRPPVSVI